jgi:hypothetical protein
MPNMASSMSSFSREAAIVRFWTSETDEGGVGMRGGERET